MIYLPLHGFAWSLHNSDDHNAVLIQESLYSSMALHLA